jgi:diadenosine tetraphosphate (Ap4A) HIT family hydrolase
MDKLPQAPKDSLLYEDDLLYACLASYPLTKGHTIVAWKDTRKDIHDLSRKEYLHLMWVVDKVRNRLLEVLGVEKVYLMYLDEVKHVHWHLIPRYNQKGYNLLSHKPKLINDFSLAKSLRIN